MISALERGDIKIELVADGRVAYVETTHMAGTSLGYTQAPIVVAFNPHFKQGQGAEYEKYTVCQYDGSWIDLNGAKSELASLEVDAGGDSASNWGGSPTIIGSPQGRSSKLSKDQIMKVVEKYLKAE